jgi:hypothetical protein
MSSNTLRGRAAGMMKKKWLMWWMKFQEPVEEAPQSKMDMTGNAQSEHVSATPEVTKILAEAAKLEAEREKTLLEVEVLKSQISGAQWWSELLKSSASLAGVLAALVAIGGLLISSYEWLHDSELSRENRIQERLEDALKEMSEDKPARRLAGVIRLKTFLQSHDSNRQSQVLLAVAGALAVEESPAVRNAEISLFRNLEPKIVDNRHLNEALDSLVQASRGLVLEGHLHARLSRSKDPFQVGSAETRAQAVASAINIFLKKGLHPSDLSGIYLANADLKSLDLSGTSFENSILVEADLTNGTLKGSSFNCANLEGTRFVSADLRGARLTQLDSCQLVDYQDDWFTAGVDVNNAILSQPDYSCADLRDADFKGTWLVGLESDYFLKRGPQPSKALLGPYFRFANIAKTKFRNVRMFGVRPPEEKLMPLAAFGHYGGQVSTQGVSYVWYAAEIDGSAPLSPEHAHFPEELNSVHSQFAGSNYSEALLPLGIQQWLREPFKIDTEEQCVQRAPFLANHLSGSIGP